MHGIFVHCRSIGLVLKQMLCRYKPTSPHKHRKASPRQAPACIISHYSQFVSPFANNLHKTCNKRKKSQACAQHCTKKALLLQSLLLIIFTCSLTLLYKRRCLAMHGIFVFMWSFGFVLIHVLYKHSLTSPPMHRKASPRTAPACIMSWLIQFVSPFANNLHKTCNLH